MPLAVNKGLRMRRQHGEQQGTRGALVRAVAVAHTRMHVHTRTAAHMRTYTDAQMHTHTHMQIKHQTSIIRTAWQLLMWLPGRSTLCLMVI